GLGRVRQPWQRQCEEGQKNNRKRREEQQAETVRPGVVRRSTGAGNPGGRAEHNHDQNGRGDKHREGNGEHEPSGILLLRVVSGGMMPQSAVSVKNSIAQSPVVTAISASRESCGSRRPPAPTRRPEFAAA